jgi:predicted transcriptional regulator
MFNHTEEIEAVMFQALAHPMRRTIFRILDTNTKGPLYTELITELGLSTGKLNYHLEQLKGLIEKNDERRYVLTPFGRKALNQLALLRREISQEDGKYVKIAETAQKTTLEPTAKALLLIGIALSMVLVSVWGYLAYIVLAEGAPTIVYLLLPVLIALGIALIATLIRALQKTPAWLRRFERRFLE